MTRLEDAAKLCMCYNLRKTSRAITQFYDKMLEPSGLAITQFSLLVGLSIAQYPTITKMANEMIIDRTTLTRNLNVLQNRGLVKIKGSSNDKGKKDIVITTKGKELLAKAFPLWEKAQRTVIQKFGNNDYNDMLSELSKIIKLIEYTHN
jgi:DNA-binding MarR family transcriptional regulator